MTATPPAAAQTFAGIDGAALQGLFTDIDDTLTVDGRLPARVYGALEALAASGLRIVPVTGRSAGWAHMILHHWPVEAVVAESGGLCLYRDGLGRPTWLHHDDPVRVARQRADIAALAVDVLRDMPDLTLANDNAFRLVDFAIDYCETVPRVDAARVAMAIERFRAAGFNARASSVHINVWAGSFDKAPMALRYLDEIRATAPETARRQWLFVGDAPNDASMFSALPLSVGVANLRPYLGQLPDAPNWITTASHGDGFVELANHLLATRARPAPGTR